MLVASWTIRDGQADSDYTISDLEYGSVQICRCKFSFEIGASKIRDIQQIQSHKYFAIDASDIVGNAVVATTRFQAFPRLHPIDIAVVTISPTGTRGGERATCTLKIAPSPAPSPPEFKQPEDTVLRLVDQSDTTIFLPFTSRGVCLRFTESLYGRHQISTIEHCSIIQCYPLLDPDDPYQGPIVVSKEVLNDQSGVALWFDALRKDHNYRLSLDTDATSMRLLYLTTKQV